MPKVELYYEKDGWYWMECARCKKRKQFGAPLTLEGFERLETLLKGFLGIHQKCDKAANDG